MNFSFFIKDSRAEQLAEQFLLEDCARSKLSRKFQIYYRLRPLIPISVRQRLQSSRRLEVSDTWYIPDSFMSALANDIQHRDESLTIIHPWPDGNQFAFVLTHDVDTGDGFEHVAKIADMEEDLGFRSAWYFIPYKYKIDEGLIKDLVSRGFEIGIHGYNHDGKLYASERTFRRRAGAINDALEKYAAVGFRSPMVHRNLDWLQLLDIQYDASYFDVDPYQAMPGGVGSIWPFVAGKFVELPYTLPQDHTLFIARGERDCRTWREKMAYVARHNGMALMLTHPDYLASRELFDLYREFLGEVQQAGGYWHALPKEVVQWWNDREQSRVELNSLGEPTVTGPLANRGRCAIVTANGDALQLRTLEGAKQPSASIS